MSIPLYPKKIIKSALGNFPKKNVSPTAVKSQNAVPTKAPSKGPTTPAHVPNVESNSIFEMQKELINISDLLSKSANPALKVGKAVEDFLKEYVSSSESLNNLISKIKNIGSSGKPDGDWGGATNAALYSLYTITFALAKVAEVFNVQTEYGANQLTEFRKNIPDDIKNFNKEQKLKMADYMQAELKKINVFINDFISKLSKDKNLYNLLTKPVQTFSKTPGVQLNKEQEEFNKNNPNATIPGVKGFTLQDLQSPESFKEFMKKINLNPASQNDIQKALDFVEKSLKGEVPATNDDAGF